jgi:adenylate cyclase
MALRGAGAALAAALAACVWRLGPGDPLTDALEARLHDLRLAARAALAPAAPFDSVALVAIDEAAVSRIGVGAPLRRALAEAVARLDAGGAAVIALDLLLVESTGSDAALASALSASGRAVLAVASLPDAPDVAPPPETAAALARAAFAVVADRESAPPPAPQPGLATPAPALAEAAAGLAHVNIARAPDRVLRRLPLALDLGGGAALPALPLEVARRALGLPRTEMVLLRGEGVRLGDRFTPADAGDRMLIDHRGPSGLVPAISLTALLAGASPPGGVAGRALFVGATAESLGDRRATPLDSDAPGVATLAATAAQLIEGRALDEGPPAALATVALAALAALAARAAALVPGVGWAALATLAVWGAAAAAAQGAFMAAGLVLDATAATAAVLAGSTLGWTAGRARDRARAAAEAAGRARLAPHVTPLLGAAEALGAAAGDPREAAVAFVDMVGSTALAEAAGPEAAGRFLAAAQARIGAAAARHGGVLVEVLGDGALVVFGLPWEGAAAAPRALAFLRDVAATDAGPPLRATAHFGPVVLVDLGSEGRRHLTVAGDAVNAAARMQDVARRLGVGALASGPLVAAAGGAPDATPAASETLPGRSTPLAMLSLG